MSPMPRRLPRLLSALAELSVAAFVVSAAAVKRGDISAAAWRRRLQRGFAIFRRGIAGTRAAEWDEVYYRRPPWEIDRPQAEYIRLLEAGEIRGRVLDVGCGTGAFVRLLLERGYAALGVDISRRAISLAKRKARERGLPEHAFEVADAFDAKGLGRRFDTVTDSAVFHCFSDTDRARYVAGLEAIVRPGGVVLVLGFSDREPTDWGGPRRLTRPDFSHAFASGWHVSYVKPARYETTLPQHVARGGGEAWLARIERLEQNIAPDGPFREPSGAKP
jgi:SAM-dependent methyltransferase